MDNILQSHSERFRKRGNTKFREGQYEEANVAYVEALENWPIDHRILANISQCHAQIKSWQKSAEAAWHCVHMCKQFPKAIWRLSRALINLRLDRAAMIVVQEGLLFNPGNDELELVQNELRTNLETQASPRIHSNPHSWSYWCSIASFVDDHDVTHLMTVATDIRHDIFQPTVSNASDISLAKQGSLSGLWQYYPPWVVSMLLDAMSRVDIRCDFVLTQADLREFFYSAYVVKAWASRHDNSSVSFACFSFEPCLFDKYLSRPDEESHYQLYSSSVGIEHCASTHLELDGSSLTISEDCNEIRATKIGMRKVFAASFAYSKLILLKSEFCEVGESVTDGLLRSGGSSVFWDYEVTKGTPWYTAIIEGRPLPFFVGVSVDNVSEEERIEERERTRTELLRQRSLLQQRRDVEI